MSDHSAPPERADEVRERLAEPFAPHEVKWKAQVIRGNRALAVAYIDARAVMDRLDEVLGLGGWQTTYRVVETGVVCRLLVRLGGEWVSHEDVGSYSDQPDDGDKIKAAFSDALKRAAVHVGIGRYLYRIPQQWVDYDPQARELKQAPKLPEWAMPQGAGTLSTAQAEVVARCCRVSGVSGKALLAKLGVTGLRQIKRAALDEVLKLIATRPAELLT